jgi:hypothetical protein
MKEVVIGSAWCSDLAGFAFSGGSGKAKSLKIGDTNKKLTRVARENPGVISMALLTYTLRIGSVP